MSDAIIYCRFSPKPKKQIENSESIEIQKDFCRKYCAGRQYKFIRAYSDENISGARRDNRPGLDKALTHVKRIRGILVVYALSRLGRSLTDMLAIVAELEAAGADLASLRETFDTSTAMGRMVFKIMVAVDEMERERVSERTKDAHRYYFQQGKRMTRPDRLPFGYELDPTDDKKIVKHPREQEIVLKIISAYEAGVSLRHICRMLTGAGILMRGKNWHHKHVCNILKREDAYNGS